MIKVLVSFLIGLIVASVAWIAVGLLTPIFQKTVVVEDKNAILLDNLTNATWHFRTDHASSDVDQTVEFSTDGKVTGFAGCNSFTGAYSIDQSVIEIGKLGLTKKLCDENVMEDEHHLVSHLEEIGATAKVTIANNKLVLKAGEESIEFTSEKAAPESPEVAGQWGYRKTVKEGVETKLVEGTSILVTFTSDGKVTGTACNSFAGTYESNPQDKSLFVSDLASTLKLCTSPEGAAAQETNFITNLTDAENYERVDSGTLKVFFTATDYLEFAIVLN